MTSVEENSSSGRSTNCAHITFQDFPRFSKFLQTHPWPVFNSIVSEIETYQVIPIFLNQVPISSIPAENMEEEKIKESQFSLSLSLASFTTLVNQVGSNIYSLTKSLKELTYKQLLEDIDSKELVFLGQSKLQAHLELSIKPRNSSITDCLAVDINQKVNITEFNLEYQLAKATPSDMEFLAKTISSLPSLEHLNMQLFFFKTKTIKDTDILPLIESLSQLTQLKRLDLKIEEKLNFLRINTFLYAIGQLLNLRKLSLKLKKCELDDHSSGCLAKSISKLTHLEELDLSIPKNKISTDGMNQVLEAISTSLCSLSKLSLNLIENKDSLEFQGVTEASQLLSKVSRESLRSLQIYFPIEYINVRKVKALSEALLRFGNLIDLSLVFESDVPDDCESDDELEDKFEEEKKSYLILFRNINKLHNLRNLNFKNKYFVSDKLAKRHAMKELPQLVVLTGMR